MGRGATGENGGSDADAGRAAAAESAVKGARVNVELPSLEYPFRLLLTPCTTFPGNPVFLIQGDKVTMLKLDR